MARILLLIALLCQLSMNRAYAAISIDKGAINAIYGKDDRQFVDSKSSREVKMLSESIAIIVSNDVVEKKVFTARITAGLLNDSAGTNLCSDEKFAEHHGLASCTGFLVGEDLLATAGHCFATESDCANKSIVFNVLAKNETSEGFKISQSNIFGCKEIVTRGLDSDLNIDFAVIRLNKKANGKKILKLRTSGLLKSKDKVFMIGHPLGLPQVLSKSASIVDNSDGHSFKAALNSFEGNSGSPVFNSSTLEVEGILVSGEEDFLLDQSLQCYRDQVYNSGANVAPELKGEGVNRISDILPMLSP